MIISVSSKIEEKGINIEILDEAFVSTFRTAIGHIAKAAHDDWIMKAQERLNSSRADYINGLRQAQSFNFSSAGGHDVYELQLVGRMANNFEFGMGSFDMKTTRPGWLGGSKSKVGKDGKRYVIIPFGHSKSSNTNKAYSGKAKAMDLKTELKKTVREYGLDKMIRTATGKVVEGKVATAKGAGVHSYLQGLVRIQTGVSGMTSTGLQRGQSQLMTFRILSENSPPEAWIHPGFEGANILPEVEQYIDNQLDNVIDNILGAVA